MAGDWIKIRFDIAEDPAVIRMADELRTREEHIVGYCHAFWCWVSRQCHDGTVTGVTLESLGRRLNLPGFPEMLVKVGWLEYDESGELPVITIPNFERHLSQGAKTRILASERQRKSRGKNVSRSDRDKSVTREEKRREDIFPPKSPQGGSSRRELRKKAGASFEELMQAWRAHSGEAQYEPAKFWARLPEATKAATRACGGFSWLSSVGATNRSSEKKKFIQAILEPQGA